MCVCVKVHKIVSFKCVQFIMQQFIVNWLSHVRLFAALWTVALQASLFFTNSQNLLKLMSTESVMPFNHLFLCHLLLLLCSIFPSIRVFSNELTLKKRYMCVSSVQFISVAQSCLTLCNPMNCSTPGLPVQHQLIAT